MISQLANTEETTLFAQVSENIDEARKLLKTLKRLVKEYDEIEDGKKLAKEYELYGNEPSCFTRKRTCIASEWEKVPIKHIIRDDLYSCNTVQNGDECWYQGNMDRMNEFELYRLKGTGYTLCDVCHGNNLSEIPRGTFYSECAYKVGFSEISNPKGILRCFSADSCWYNKPYGKNDTVKEWYYIETSKFKVKVCDMCCSAFQEGNNIVREMVDELYNNN